MLTDLCLPNSADAYMKGKHCDRCGLTTHAKGGVDITATKFVCAKCWRFSAVTKSNPNKTRKAA